MKKHLVLSAKVNEELLREPPHTCLEFLPESMQLDVMKYSRKHKQWLSLTGKLLLVKGLKMLGKNDLINHPLSYSIHKRPSLDDSIDFNISHSGNRVICVITVDQRVGIDIQEKGNYKIAETSRLFFDEGAKQAIHTKKKNSLELWCRTEALAKAIGTGLNKDITNFNILESTTNCNGEQWNFWKLPVDPAFECIMVTNEIHPEIELYKFRFKTELLKGLTH